MSKYARKVDKTQAGIVRALKAVGASVMDLSAAGAGFPDLVVGFRGITYLIECKTPRKQGGKDKILDTQKEFADSWNGSPPIICHGSEAALKAIGVL